jgi:outer membrane usher protein FimD/PapC
VDYGLENFDYDGAFAYGWLRHGIDFNVTGELRGEADSDGAAVGAGTDLLLGDLGVLSVGAAASQGPRGNGTRYLLGFDRQTPFLSFGARVTRASPSYREIGDVGPQISQASAAFFRTSFGRYGSLAFGYAGQRYHGAEPVTLYSASYSFNVGARAYMTLTGSKILGVQNQTQALALLTVPLDTLTSATVSAHKAFATTARQRASARPTCSVRCRSAKATGTTCAPTPSMLRPVVCSTQARSAATRSKRPPTTGTPPCGPR